MEFTIPITVKGRTQRTLKLIGAGLKTLLTTKVSGTLIVRRKNSDSDLPTKGILPFRSVPPMPRDPQPSPAAENSFVTILATVWVEDIHEDLVKQGIKVRDFAYPAKSVGHTKPLDPTPLVNAAGADPTIPSSLETCPMPCISPTWTEAHPAIRPLPKRQCPPFEGSCPPVEVPTPDKPYQPIYDTHRIPGWFCQAQAVTEIDFRLSEPVRTIPIRGISTRRLLTLSPDLVPLERYHEMDLEELRRYDRCLVYQAANGVAPYPWRATHPPNWVPSPETRAKMLKMGIPAWHRWDERIQQGTWQHYYVGRLEDQEWETKENSRCHEANVAANLHLNERPPPGVPLSWDFVDDKLIEGKQVSMRQVLTAWERRMDSDLAHPNYDSKLSILKLLRTAEEDADAAEVVADTGLVMDVEAVVPSVAEAEAAPPAPIAAPPTPPPVGDAEADPKDDDIDADAEEDADAAEAVADTGLVMDVEAVVPSVAEAEAAPPAASPTPPIAAPPTPPSAHGSFIPGQENYDPFTTWGPYAPHTGAAYRRSGGTPSSLTLNDHLEQLMGPTAPAPAPARLPPVDFFAFSGPYLNGQSYTDANGVERSASRLVDDPSSYPAERVTGARKRDIDEVEPATDGTPHRKRRRTEESADEGDLPEVDEAQAASKELEVRAESPVRKRGIDEVETAQGGAEEDAEGRSPKRART